VNVVRIRLDFRLGSVSFESLFNFLAFLLFFDGGGGEVETKGLLLVLIGLLVV